MIDELTPEYLKRQSQERQKRSIEIFRRNIANGLQVMIEEGEITLQTSVSEVLKKLEIKHETK